MQPRCWGGRNGVKAARCVVDAFKAHDFQTPRVARAIDDLRGLLQLENVHDMSREEAGHFAAIDPADPCVEEICYLADALCHAIIGHANSYKWSVAA